jgi:hypothetical protein
LRGGFFFLNANLLKQLQRAIPKKRAKSGAKVKPADAGR